MTVAYKRNLQKTGSSLHFAVVSQLKMARQLGQEDRRSSKTVEQIEPPENENDDKILPFSNVCSTKENAYAFTALYVNNAERRYTFGMPIDDGLIDLIARFFFVTRASKIQWLCKELSELLCHISEQDAGEQHGEERNEMTREHTADLDDLVQSISPKIEYFFWLLHETDDDELANRLDDFLNLYQEVSAEHRDQQISSSSWFIERIGSAGKHVQSIDMIL